MPHSDRAALDGFFAELRRAWRMAGPPSYQDFEDLSMRVAAGAAKPSDRLLSRSTTQGILAGQRAQLPKWRWVARFHTVLRVAAEQAGADPRTLGTLADWKQQYEAAWNATAARPRLARAARGDTVTAGSGTGCASGTGRASGRPRAAGRATGLLVSEEDADRNPELTELLRAVGQDWWHDYRDLVPDWLGVYLSLEPAASLIRAYETTLVPGLLQTEDYAAAAIKLSWLASDRATVARLVELRMRRQQFLHRPGAPRLWVIIDETAVRHRLGGAKTMRRQIRHLIDVSQQPNIRIQVIPLDTSVHAVAGGPITFLRFPAANLPDAVYLEQLTGTVYLPHQGVVNHYRNVLSRLGIEALSPAETTILLRDVLMEI
jgi:hypothetical protein